MALKKGDTAPDFKLINTNKEWVNLSDLRGKNVLLLFFPLAFTGVCTKELCSIRDNLGFYNNIQADVFGISVDSNATLAKFKEDQKLSFTLLSDFNKEASAAYDVLYENFGWMKGVSKRSAFVIDKAGIIQYEEILENAGEVPDFEAINSSLQEISQ
jgi:glutaredoxin-dependent peroxiredoxin